MPFSFRIGARAGAGIVLALLGCAEVPEAPPGVAASEPGIEVDPNRRVVFETTTAPSTAAGGALGLTDASGSIHTQVVACTSSVASSNPGVICRVDSTFVVVGGGAVANWFGAGALLTASTPFDETLSGWQGQSKDHVHPDPHTLTVYAIGMRLGALSRSELRENMQLSGLSTTAAHPSVEMHAPTGMLILSGGGRLSYQGAGSMLVASQPSPSCGAEAECRTWLVKAKDHLFSDPARLTGRIITIKKEIPGVASFVQARAASQGSTVSVGVSTARVAGGDGTVVTAFGGAALDDTSGRPGRMLYRIAPDASVGRGVIVQAKDHIEISPGHTVAHVLTLRNLRR